MKNREKTCPTCKRSPVSGKTWSLLTQQDDLIRVLKKQRDELRVVNQDLQQQLNDVYDMVERANPQYQADLAKALSGASEAEPMSAEELIAWLREKVKGGSDGA